MDIQNTLETAGYVYNPFTTNDIWGHPSALALRSIEKENLPVGADDGALPDFSDPFYGRPGPVQGSGYAAQHRPTRREIQQQTNMTTLAIFGALLALALWL